MSNNFTKDETKQLDVTFQSSLILMFKIHKIQCLRTPSSECESLGEIHGSFSHFFLLYLCELFKISPFIIDLTQLAVVHIKLAGISSCCRKQV